MSLSNKKRKFNLKPSLRCNKRKEQKVYFVDGESAQSPFIFAFISDSSPNNSPSIDTMISSISISWTEERN